MPHLPPHLVSGKNLLLSTVCLCSLVRLAKPNPTDRMMNTDTAARFRRICPSPFPWATVMGRSTPKSTRAQQLPQTHTARELPLAAVCYQLSSCLQCYVLCCVWGNPTRATALRIMLIRQPCGSSTPDDITHPCTWLRGSTARPKNTQENRGQPLLLAAG